MKDDPYVIIKHPLVTEKGSRLKEETNTYPFKVDARANKIEIAKAVEKIYNVKVTSVRTIWLPGKPRRARHKYIQTPEWKKAYVTLAEGNVIELM